MDPTLSVITICFNNLSDLQKTCQSVDEQTVNPDEHLLIDGSTNEEIVNWLLQNPQPAYRRWIHERDKGISDAFNKGIENATGELTHLLNSGDTYAVATSIETILNKFRGDSSLSWVHSQYIQHRGDMDVISGLPFEKGKLWKGMRMVAHPTMFIKNEVYKKYGMYNTDYKIAMDYDMLVRMRNEKFDFIAAPLVYFAPGGASHKQFKRGLAEVKKSYVTHIGSDLRLSVWQFRQRLLQAVMETFAGKKLFQWKNNQRKV